MKGNEKITEALQGFRALDLTEEKGLFCGKLLADLGVDVIKIERPGGDLVRRKGPFYKDLPDPEKSLFWWALNLGKRGITLNVEDRDGQEIFKRLVASADFVIESFAPGYLKRLGLDYLKLSKINSKIIMTSISPFGRTGPYRDWKASDLVMIAMGGQMYLLGDPDRRPVRISYPQAYFIAAGQAVAGMLIAHWWREKTGEGQHVDVSIQESVAWITQDATLFWDLTRSNVTRAGPLRRRPDTGVTSPFVWRCKDGYVCYTVIGGTMAGATQAALVQWMDSEGMADDFLRGIDWPNFDWATQRQADVDPIVERFGAFFSKHTVDELFQGALQRRIILQPVATAEDVVQNEQLSARGVWVQVEHGELGASITYPRSPLTLLGSEGKQPIRAPLVGEHNVEIFKRELGLSTYEMVTLKQRGVI